MEGPHPTLKAFAALDRDVAAASVAGSGAVARIPADDHRAGPPRMMTAALLREERPGFAGLLVHASILPGYRTDVR